MTKLTEFETEEIANELRDYRKQHVIKDANEWFEQNIRYLQRQSEELQRYQERFNHAVKHHDKFCTPANVLSWAVNSLVHITPNLRIDSAIDKAVELSASGVERR